MLMSIVSGGRFYWLRATTMNYFQLANSQLAYSVLVYSGVLFGWLPVIGYGAIRGSGG